VARTLSRKNFDKNTWFLIRRVVEGRNSFSRQERIFVKLVKLILRERALGKRTVLHTHFQLFHVTSVESLSQEYCKREGKYSASLYKMSIVLMFIILISRILRGVNLRKIIILKKYYIDIKSII